MRWTIMPASVRDKYERLASSAKRSERLSMPSDSMGPVERRVELSFRGGAVDQSNQFVSDCTHRESNCSRFREPSGPTNREKFRSIGGRNREKRLILFRKRSDGSERSRAENAGDQGALAFDSKIHEKLLCGFMLR